MEQTIYVKMRNRLQVSPDYEIKIGDVAQVVGESHIVDEIKRQAVYKITKKDKTHVVIDVMKVIQAIRQYSNSLEINLLGSAQTIVEIVYEKNK